ncbi:heme ABC exporter ATP-binding protein CcmA [Deinococcus ruber]|uniref:Heme ABC exporter ATP-binding protein CcmA n=1 Tax=Deinococcus ruber TaxID=1848197 RepID=A0A918FDL9_9DEIO|nr:heme ABC exporter ATP-binding protein CcmA [Deinococcus ruber]
MVAPLSAELQATDLHAVQLRAVWLRLGRDAVLRGLDLDVRAGESVTLLGGNGAGKSTLLRLIASALSPTRGEGRIFGFDLRDRRSVREHVHLLGHDLGLYPDLTPSENLQFALKMHGQQGDIRAALERAGILRAADRRVRFLSAGMKKRLALARLALLARPLTLVDEPFANLDAEGRELAVSLLNQAQASGSTLIVAAHEPELSLRVAARALVLSGGVLEAGLLEVRTDDV